MTRRIWAETALALVSATLLVIALVAPDWIEAVVGIDLDRHSGLAEWLMAVGLTALTIGLAGHAGANRFRFDAGSRRFARSSPGRVESSSIDM